MLIKLFVSVLLPVSLSLCVSVSVLMTCLCSFRGEFSCSWSVLRQSWKPFAAVVLRVKPENEKRGAIMTWERSEIHTADNILAC